MNSSTHRVWVRDDPPKHAKLKGIDVVVMQPGTNSTATERTRRTSSNGNLQRVDTRNDSAELRVAGRSFRMRTVTGVRIEFKNEEERNEFVEMSHRVQKDRLIPLPDL